MLEISMSLAVTPNNTPLAYISSDGRVYFDLGKDFDIVLANAATKTTLDGFSEVIAVPFNLPNSPKNDWILSKYRHMNIYNANQLEGLEVYVVTGALTLPQTYLSTTSASPIAGYQCELTYSNTDVLFQMKNTLLSDVMAQSFVIDLDEFAASYFPLNKYNGTTDICYPVVNYGCFYYLADGDNRLKVHTVEFRPWIFTAAIVKKALCGLTLKGSFFESDLWLKDIGYYLRKDYDRIQIYKRGFSRRRETTAVPSGSTGLLIPYHNVVEFDPDNNYQVIPAANAGASAVNRHGVYNVRASFLITLLSTPTTGGANITFRIKGTSGTVYNEQMQFFPLVAGTQKQFIFDSVLDVKPDEAIFIEIDGLLDLANFGNFTYSSAFVFIPEKDTTPYEGETDLNLRSFIDPTLTVFDVFEAKCGQACFNLRFSLNRATNELWAYSENATSVFGDSVQPLAHTNKSALDWTNKTILDSQTNTFNQGTKSLKDITVQWKNASDRFITQVLQPPKQLFSYYNLVNGQGTDSLKLENSLIEPTATDRYWLVTTSDGAAITAELSGAPYIPILMDNLDNRHSYDLGVRALQLAGEVVQSLTDLDIIPQFDFLSTIGTSIIGTTAFSFATMFYQGDFVTGSVNTNLTFDALPLNLYNQLIEKGINRKYNGAQTEILVLLNRNDFFNFDFTQYVLVWMYGNSIQMQVNDIQGFSLTKNIPCKVTLLQPIDGCL